LEHIHRREHSQTPAVLDNVETVEVLLHAGKQQAARTAANMSFRCRAEKAMQISHLPSSPYLKL
jgi:hypothetical protein